MGLPFLVLCCLTDLLGAWYCSRCITPVPFKLADRSHESGAKKTLCHWTVDNNNNELSSFFLLFSSLEKILLILFDIP